MMFGVLAVGLKRPTQKLESVSVPPAESIVLCQSILIIAIVVIGAGIIITIISKVIIMMIILILI